MAMSSYTVTPTYMNTTARKGALSLRGLLILCLATAAFLAAVFIRIMNYELRRDENLYATPAALLQQYQLYTDIFYNHVPNSAWLFYGLNRLLGLDHLLFGARLGVFLGWVMLGVAIPVMSYALTRSLAMTLLALALVFGNDLLLGPAGMAGTNNLLPLSFGYLGLGLFVLGLTKERARPYLIGISGLSLAIAAGVKESAIGYVIPVAMAAFFLPRQLTLLRRLGQVVVPLAIGGAAGALPVIFYLTVAPIPFLSNILGWHLGPQIAYWHAQSDVVEAVTLGEKVRFAHLVWSGGATLFFIFLPILLVAILARGKDPAELRRNLLTGPIVLMAATLALTMVLSFAPTPSFPQYFAPPLVPALLLTTLLYAKLDEPRRLASQPALLAALAVVLLISAPRLTQNLGEMFSPDRWTVSRVHRDGVAIAERVAASGVTGKIATLVPIYPLEAKLPVYREFATGQFAYRTAAFTSAADMPYYNTVSPDSVGDLFAADPPAALLLGFEPDLEAPMLQFAEENGYVRAENFRVVDRYGEGVLYVRR